MFSRRTVVRGALALLAAISLTACNSSSQNGAAPSGGGPTSVSGGSAGGGGKKVIAFVFKSASQYSEACKKGATQANDELSASGTTVEYYAPEKGDNLKQVQQIEQLIANKVSAIVVSPNDAKGIAPVLKKASGAGIKVYTWDSDAPGSTRLFYVAAADDVGIGVDIAENLAKGLGGKGKVAIMSGGPAAANLNLHIQGVEEGLKKYPGITVLKPYLYNEEDQNKAVELAKTAFQKDPDIKGFAGVNSQAPPGIGEAITQQNKIGQVKVWGLALPSVMKPYLKSGAVEGVILWDPSKLTYLTAILVNDDLNGKKPEDGKEYPEIGKIKVTTTADGTFVQMPSTTFNKENVDNYDF
jgi:ABC-type sugar transport system substrate-binding protein